MNRTLATLALTIATLTIASPANAMPDGQVSRHAVVKSSTLPHCHYEDGSGGPLPCSWNFDDTDGNGEGLAYWVSKTHRFHYVWATSPLKGHPQREWISPEDADAMDEGSAPDATTRDWEKCWVHFGNTTTKVKCADGYTYRDAS